MATGKVHNFNGTERFRQRLVLATLSAKPVRFENIRTDDADAVGLKDYEVSFMRLIDKLTNGSVVSINHTGTTVSYRPGMIMGGKISHPCPPSKGIGYFLEAMIMLAPFAKKPLQLTLTGITNNEEDPSVDVIRTVTLPMLHQFGLEGDVELKITKRGAAPLGGGEIYFKCPTVRSLKPIKINEMGRVKRIRGISFSTRVSPQTANRVVDAARGVLNKLLPDVYIYTDHYRGAEAGKSPGFGLSLVAESTNGNLCGSECVAAPGELPEDLGTRAAWLILEEISRGGCIDTQNQALCCLFMACNSEDVSKVKFGKLSSFTVNFLRDVREFLGVTFRLKPDDETDTVNVTCIGIGYTNTSKKMG
eukprot:m.76598 g.76598  ORF g.76598 m.76598 type:complete len:362 (+) comp24918_c0_seq1:207-1292(+)